MGQADAMKLLNLGCGAVRPPPPWVNVDDLFGYLAPHPTGAAAIEALHTEPNYLNADISDTPWLWGRDGFDGILASHFFEHLTTPAAVKVMAECRRVLRPGGVLRVAVPDAAYFRQVHAEDRRENWARLFEDYSDASDATTYMRVALFFGEHLQTYTEDALWCQLTDAGFKAVSRVAPNESGGGEAGRMMAERDNRPRFSLIMEAYK